jgi:hypothetical protein
MSYNQIRGFANGAFEDLSMLFYAGPSEDGMTQSWVPLASEAQTFESMDDAKKHADEIWGSYTAASFMYAYIEIKPHEYMDDYSRKQIGTRDAFRRRLAMRLVTPDELRAMSEHVIDSGMRYTEKWIVDIMSEEQNSGS